MATKTAPIDTTCKRCGAAPGLPCMDTAAVRTTRVLTFRTTQAPDVHRARLLEAYRLNNPVDASRPAWR